MSGPTTSEEIIPDGLMIDFLHGTKVFGIKNQNPEFGWIVHSNSQNDIQIAYHILVASDREKLQQNQGDMWDSKRCDTSDSINIPYHGKFLQSYSEYFWKVKTWCKFGGESEWSDIMEFTTAKVSCDHVTIRYSLEKSKILPKTIKKKSRGHFLIDFGKVAFGFLHLIVNNPKGKKRITIHFAERGTENGINKRPGRNIRYNKTKQQLFEGENDLIIHPPQNKRHLISPAAIKIPKEIGTVTPFRYVEIEHCPIELNTENIQQIAIHYPFNENAASFESSNSILNHIWDLCKYSVKATSFTGVYIDGDRERIPYEADAYINQLCHYAVDREFSLARYSHEYLLIHPTWPTEWKHHSVMMAWTDYMYTGNLNSLRENYDVLKFKTLDHLAREDGLLDTTFMRDNVDWPIIERDEYEFKPVNTVINAFYYKTLIQMADIAKALDYSSDIKEYQTKAEKFMVQFNKIFYDETRGIYLDGENATHASLHANMIPLAFGLVPEERKKTVTDFIVSKGMACSVYAAQYLLEALYESGRADVAFERMVSIDIRSWYNMLRVGSTITLEAWDNKFKPNQDWNHAWGAVPGNIIPRYLLGIRPLEAGFSKVLIQPQPAFLENGTATVPTIRGSIKIAFENIVGISFKLIIEIPVNMTAKVILPHYHKEKDTILVDDAEKTASILENGLCFNEIGSGNHVFIS